MFTIAIAVLVMGQNPSSGSIPLYSGLGKHSRKVETNSPLAQRYFDQGLNLLFAFNHDEARASFKQATRIDPKCAMAWWGIATTNGPHINFAMVPPALEKEAFDAIHRAKALIKSNGADRALIEASIKRFADPQPESRAELDLAYANAMRSVWKRFPRDADAGALFAEAMMDLRPWDLWKLNGQPQPGTLEVVATLEQVMRVNKMHPLANHLYVHAVEASLDPYRAMGAANRLRQLQPGLGHNTHMPSHIDVRTGKWHESILSNQRAIKADSEYAAKQPNQGMYRLYMAHNVHMLGFGGMMCGQSKLAITAMDQMVGSIPKELPDDLVPVMDGFISMPVEVRVRFGKWNEVLAAPEPDAKFPFARAMRSAARAIAFAATGRIDEARFEQADLVLATERLPQGAFFGNNKSEDLLKVANAMVAGEILISDGKLEAGIKELYRAARLEDQLRYAEPPDWILPIRHPLGAALLKAGRPAEAIKVYKQDLAEWPENGWSLYGMSQAYKRLGRTRDAAEYTRRFNAVWKGADISIPSSCMCIPKT